MTAAYEGHRADARWAHVLGSLSATPLETQFLRACLLERDAARAAWASFQASRESTHELGGLHPLERVFSGLLLRAASRHGFELETTRRVGLKAHSLVEARRREKYLGVLREVVTALDEERLAFLLTRGCALAETVYPAPLLRHAHDIDVLLAEPCVARAREALLDAGLRDATGVVSPAQNDGAARHVGRARVGGWAHVEVQHGSGLPVVLHSRPFRWSPHHVPFETVAAEAHTVDVASTSVCVSAPHHALLQACVQSLPTVASPLALRWVTDAGPRVARADEAFWRRLVNTAVQHRLSAPLAITLAFLARQLEAVIPDGVLADLAAAGRLDSMATARDVVPLLRAAPRSLRGLVALDGPWTTRLRVGLAMAWPSAAFMRARRGLTS